VIKYEEEGFVEWNGNLYHLVKYPDPRNNLRAFIHTEKGD